jgi:hypothetical protein
MLLGVGFLKNRQLEQDEMWFSAPFGHAVCSDCIADSALREFVGSNLDSVECSFCGRSADTDIAADTDVVLAFMSECLKREWARPIDEYFQDAESSTGYAGPSYPLGEILGDEPPTFANEAFERFVLDAFAETEWAPRDYAAINENEALRFGWSDLVETVKHQQRFFFLLEDDEPRDDGPGAEVRRGRAMLDQLGHLIRKYELVHTIPRADVLYRCRPHKSSESPTSAQELGPPPPEKAIRSRMSPAGIPTLYAADQPETTLAETIDGTPTDEDVATIGTWELLQDCLIVDLNELPAVPSIFESDAETTRRRHELGFLHGFRRDVSGSVKRDGREHIDYVPTQVVAEYLRFVFRNDDGQPVQGVAWESSKLPGTRNVVLFIDASQCVDEGQQGDGHSRPVVELKDHELRQLA